MKVLAVHASPRHWFAKETQHQIRLLEGLGVEGDAHAGRTVQHRSRVARDPFQPNLRQVHLLHAELLAELEGKGFALAPGRLGENITTEGLDLLGFPVGTRLRIGTQALVELTGLRNPCSQLDKVKPGLMAAVLDRTPEGRLVRKAGVMGVVVEGGVVRAGDGIALVDVPKHGRPLEPV